MLSAPATIPPITPGIFRWAFAPPWAARVSLLATSSARPHRCARAMTGATPAHDTRFGSSNTASTLLGL